MKKTFKELKVGDKIHCLTHTGYLYIPVTITKIDQAYDIITFSGNNTGVIQISNPSNTNINTGGLFITTDLADIITKFKILDLPAPEIDELVEENYLYQALEKLKQEIDEAEKYYMQHKETLEQILKSYESND